MIQGCSFHWGLSVLKLVKQDDARGSMTDALTFTDIWCNCFFSDAPIQAHCALGGP